MTPDRWILLAQLLVPIMLGLLMFAAKKWFEDIVSKKIQPMDDVVNKIHISLEQRNGGSSVRDQLVFIRQDIKELDGRFDQHIIDHAASVPKKLHSRKAIS